jgi:hypothetical protein
MCLPNIKKTQCFFVFLCQYVKYDDHNETEVYQWIRDFYLILLKNSKLMGQVINVFSLKIYEHIQDVPRATVMPS